MAKPLTSVDTAWLRMEDPTNLMMITGVLVFGAPIDVDRLKSVLEHGLLCFDRFRQRVVPAPVVMVAGGSPLSGLQWEAAPAFNLDDHVKRIRLAPPGDQAALQDVASELASTPLDLAKPLWEFHLVENYGPGCALICRLHHSIGDGIALVHVLLSLTDTEPDAPRPAPAAAEAPGGIEKAGRRARGPVHAAVRSSYRMTRRLAREGIRATVDRGRRHELARLGVRGSQALARLLLLWPDPKTVFKGPLGVPKRAAWSGPLPLGEVKAVGHALEGTVNDVLLSAMAGALRRYMAGRGESPEGVNIRAVIPVDLRPKGVTPDLGNKFGLVFLALPVGIGDPRRRLHEFKRRMDALKDSLEAPVAFGILTAIGMATQQIQDIVVNIFGSKGTAVMTNVIGPRQRIYLAGAPLETLMFWVPQSGRLGLGVSILSYAGQVRLGIITDEGLVPDPETIVEAFHTEFDDLVAMARRAAACPTVKTVAAQLDEALASLDALLATNSDEAAEGLASEARCQALTKAGEPCKNRALPGSPYCWRHKQTLSPGGSS
jgi:diacylglycerol O-acyltransferase